LRGQTPSQDFHDKSFTKSVFCASRNGKHAEEAARTAHKTQLLAPQAPPAYSAAGLSTNVPNHRPSSEFRGTLDSSPLG